MLIRQLLGLSYMATLGVLIKKIPFELGVWQRVKNFRGNAECSGIEIMCVHLGCFFVLSYSSSL